jgi:putative heme-binding domain-containing protein
LEEQRHFDSHRASSAARVRDLISAALELDDGFPIALIAVPPLLERNDPFEFAGAVEAFSQSELSADHFAAVLRGDLPSTARLKLAMALAARKKFAQHRELARLGLEHADPLIRRMAVQWVAEEKLLELRPQVEAMFNQPAMSSDLFLAVLAALEMLDGVDPAKFDKTPAGKYVLPILLDDKRPAAVRAQALRLVEPDDPALKVELLAKLIAGEHRELRLEALRTLQGSRLPEASTLLTQMAIDRQAEPRLRAEAIVGLGPAIANTDKAAQQAALALLRSTEPGLTVEALRALRGADRTNPQVRESLTALAKRLPESLDPAQRETAEELARLLPESDWPKSVRTIHGQRPTNAEQWMAALDEAGDAEAGRRVFFHPLGAGCWKCHTVDGRGGAVGPDLSMIARTMNRQKLAQSILEPAKEIAPQFTTWTFVMTTGQVHQGMILGDTRDNKQRIGLSDGRQLELRTDEIELREPSPLSIMPANLIEQLTVSEFRHLLAFLETLR